MERRTRVAGMVDWDKTITEGSNYVFELLLMALNRYERHRSFL